MTTIDLVCENAIEIANDDSWGYTNVYPFNWYWDDDKQIDCGCFICLCFYLAGVLKRGEYFEPTGEFIPWNEQMLLSYCDRLDYDDNRNQKGDILVSAGHTVLVIETGDNWWEDDIAHACNDYDGIKGDSSGREIRTQKLYDGGWNWIYRLKPEFNKNIDENISTSLVELPDLKKGSKGGEVETLQALLNEKLGAELLVDGIYGDLTENAVRHYQEKFKCGNADGWVGKMTWSDILTRNA